MTQVLLTRVVALVAVVVGASTPVVAQSEFTGSYRTLMHEDYIERGPGSFMGDFTGMPLTDDGRAKALLYTSNLPDTRERQCLAQSGGVFQYRPVTIRIWKEFDGNTGRVLAWVIGGDNLRGDIRIWMDGRPHPVAERSAHRGRLRHGSGRRRHADGADDASQDRLDSEGRRHPRQRSHDDHHAHDAT